uniref:Uncharacterized protein n=1 Tax=Rhizophora mucronata TaxID=61149 RepID=A0A2P2PZV3_RHIMU
MGLKSNHFSERFPFFPFPGCRLAGTLEESTCSNFKSQVL